MNNSGEFLHTISASAAAETNQGQSLALHGADLRLHRQWLPVATADAWLQELRASLPWRQDPIRVFGRWHQQPRLTAWVGDADAVYTYSGLPQKPLPWTPLLTNLRQQLEASLNVPFNSVLLNLYRHGDDSMGWHSDDEPELGPAPVIASVSLGATRSLRFRPRQWPAGQRRESTPVPLEHGSLLVMAGSTQANWQHALPKSRRVQGSRLNLTFRQVLGPAQGQSGQETA